MKILVTGGAGFIGRWVVAQLLSGGREDFRFVPAEVVVMDNLSNGRKENILPLMDDENFIAFYENDLLDNAFLDRMFSDHDFDLVLHLAACINVQQSIDNPRMVFESDVVGTMNLLEHLRAGLTPIIFMSTCMVYDMAEATGAIDESHPTRPASPYAGAKLAAEAMVKSYFHAYKLPVLILRPFNTYGPYQKSDGEGGVISIFIHKELENADLNIFGDGTQTRDFMYVEDCAEFICKAAFSGKLDGSIYNAGSGRDITVNDLAAVISGDSDRIKHVPHIHPQSEIQKLLCDSKKAMAAFSWKPRIDLETGVAETRRFIESES